jgi:hypothetical protein
VIVAHPLADGCGPLAVPFRSPCGPFAVSRPTNSREHERTRAPDVQRFRGYSPVFAAVRGSLTNSGRQVQSAPNGQCLSRLLSGLLLRCYPLASQPDSLAEDRIVYAPPVLRASVTVAAIAASALAALGGGPGALAKPKTSAAVPASEVVGLKPSEQSVVTAASTLALADAGTSQPKLREAITRAVRAPYEAFFHRDPAALCAAFTPTAASQLVADAPAGSSCQSAVAEVFAQTAPYQPPLPVSLPASWTVTHIVAHGSSATAEVIYGKEGKAPFSLQKIAGVWLVSNRSKIVTVEGCGGAARTTPCPATARVMYFVIAPLSVGSGPPLVPIPEAVKRAGGSALSEFKAGRVVFAQSGCEACHRIGTQGNAGPGPNLTHIGARLSSGQIRRAIVSPSEPMPSFKNLPPAKLKAIVEFLSLLR